METLAIPAIRLLVEVWEKYGPVALVFFTALLVTICWAILWFRKQVSGAGMGRRRADYPRLRHVLRERIETDHQVNHVLANLIRALDCDRVYVNQYHNGGENICGVPFTKCSRTHERVRPGTPAQIAAIQSLPNSVFAGTNLAIMRDREISCPDIELLRSDDPMGVYHSLREQGIRSLYQIGMFSFDHVPIGTLGVDFCRGPKTLSKADLESLKACAMKLCGMLLTEQSRRGDAYECAADRD